jgi:hypothetical protein
MHLDIPPQGSRLARPASGPNLTTQPAGLRITLCIFGAVLALCGLWLLTPELLRSKPVAASQNGAGAAAKASAQSTALLAAQIGGIRGDLWAEAALAEVNLLWLDRPAALDRANAGRLEQSRSYMEKALALAPINGEAWLVLAALPANPANSGDGRIATLLQMSYFTAPNDLHLADLRLARAATSAALGNKDIQEFVKSDIRRILTYQPQLKSAIVAAYRNALPQNRPIVEALTSDVDPALGEALRSGQQK